MSKSLIGVSRVTIQKPVTTTLTTYNMEKIKELEGLITYSLVLDRGTFKLCLQSKKTNCTTHYGPNTYKNLLDPPDQVHLESTSSPQIESPITFPNRTEDESLKQEDLMNMYHENKDTFEDFEVDN